MRLILEVKKRDSRKKAGHGSPACSHSDQSHLNYSKDSDRAVSSEILLFHRMLFFYLLPMMVVGLARFC